MTKQSPDKSTAALRELVNIAEVEIEHLTALLHVEDEIARKVGRYEGTGGVPLPEDLKERFQRKLDNITFGRALLLAGIKKTEAQTASGSAEREPT